MLLKRLTLFFILTILGFALCAFLASRLGILDSHLPTSPHNPKELTSEVLTRVKSMDVSESSGITLSPTYKNAGWTHNDSGGQPRLFLVSTETGETQIQLTLSGAKNRDWEDIDFVTTDKGNYIAVGDIGDNQKFRRSCQIYFIPEPKVTLQPGKILKIETKDWVQQKFRYDEGAMNCESLAFDPTSDSLFLVQKLASYEKGPSRVHQLPLTIGSPEISIAKKVATIEGLNYSAMDISDDGQQMVLRVYNGAFFLTKKANQTWSEFLVQSLPKWYCLPPQMQGEGICFYPKGDHVLLSSEHESATLIRVEIPEG